ncbi:MAG: hypothetical protein HY599_06130, partial [Candidatus Omnitrophica bacterium]|nr:hypothetical protein [Candidatus Omnitrophota bacterium]
MLWVIGCWTLAMVSGLCWARAYTGALTAATAIAFIWTQAAQLGAWTGWA